MKLKQTGKMAPASKPWKLIRDAISDLRLQEKLKSVRIDMCTGWHESYDDVCEQCLGGCVMSRRLGADLKEDLLPSDFPKFQRRINALNSFRAGNLLLAYHKLEIEPPKRMPRYFDIPPYEEDSEGFKQDMLVLADVLEESHKQGYWVGYIYPNANLR